MNKMNALVKFVAASAIGLSFSFSTFANEQKPTFEQYIEQIKQEALAKGYLGCNLKGARILRDPT